MLLHHKTLLVHRSKVVKIIMSWSGQSNFNKLLGDFKSTQSLLTVAWVDRSCLLRWSAILWRRLSSSCNTGLSRHKTERRKMSICLKAWVNRTTSCLSSRKGSIARTCCTAARLCSWAVLRLCCCWSAAVCNIRCCCWAAYICCRYCAAVLGCLCNACWNTCTKNIAYETWWFYIQSKSINKCILNGNKYIKYKTAKTSIVDYFIKSVKVLSHQGHLKK